MLFADHLIVVRGGGDLGTGVVWRLHRCGFPVIVFELEHPLTIRRTVALSSAVEDGVVDVEGLIGRRVPSLEAGLDRAGSGEIPVLVESGLPTFTRSVVIDARIAKRCLDTTRADAPLVVALGPGFAAGADCHAVVETARGHHLGRVIWAGSALPDTGRPGEVGGRGAERVLRSPGEGTVRWQVRIGDLVEAGALLGDVAGHEVRASISGVVRGLISSSAYIPAGLKIADIDPRLDTNCLEISDKALAIGGGVVEAVMTWISATR